MAKDTIAVLLDTDIGSDIDDAVCLSYLLRQPRCELVGITTVSGQPDKRAALADAVCRAAGRTDIPIHAGCARGIMTGEVVQPDCRQAEILPRFAHREPSDFEPNSAVEFLRRTIRSRPGELTLLGIGPMTNIGLLSAIDPEAIGMLARIVVMCGVFTTRLPNSCISEWNARCDPPGAALLYRARVPDHLSIGLDVTMQVTMEVDQCLERFRRAGGPMTVVAAATEVWRGKHKMTFHDPLAGATIFHPELCKYEKGTVTVELKSDQVPGMTHFDTKAKEPRHRVAVEVDVEGFFREYYSVVGAP